MTSPARRRATRPVLLGALLGAAGAFAGARFVESLVFGVAPTEPMLYAAVATSVLLLAAVAAWIPAHRAARLDARALLLRG